MSFCNEITPVAAKKHQCILCGEDINIGVKHVKRTGVWNGDFSSFRMHAFCCEVANEEYDADAWEFHDVGEFREILHAYERGRAAEL